MTKREFIELYDSLYYGHDVELELNGVRYFVEWNSIGADIFLLNADKGSKIGSVVDREKSKIVQKIFDFKFDGKMNLNSSYSEINIIDIE